MRCRRLLVLLVWLVASNSVLVSREAAAAPVRVEQFCCGQLVASDADGRVVLFSSPARYDRMTGLVQRTRVDSNIVAMDDEGRFVADAYGLQHDLLTGDVVDLGGRLLDSDALADKIIVLHGDGSQSLIQRSTGTVIDFPPGAGITMLSPSGRFVGIQETDASHIQNVKLLDTATGKTYLLRRSSTIVDVANDGSVVLGSYSTDTAPKQYYDVNSLTGVTFRLPGAELAYEPYVAGNALSDDGTIIMARIQDQITIIDATTRESTTLGQWPNTNSVWISQPFLQGDGRAVLYSMTDLPVIGPSTQASHVVTLPVRASESPHVRSLEVVEVDVSGLVPANAAAAALNVTVTNPTTAGFITAFTCGAQLPVASNVNFVASQTIPNAVIVRPSSSGKVCLLSSAASDLVVDLQGYVPPGGPFVGVGPNRILDSRTGLGLSVAGKLPNATRTRLQVIGTPGVPSSISAVALNVTVTEAARDGFLTVYPCTDEPPTASNLNFTSGQTIANAVFSSLDAGGAVCLYSNATTHVVVDVDGYLGSNSGFVGVAPTRVLDSRITVGVPSNGAIPAGGTVSIPLIGQQRVPADATSVVLNVTATEPVAAGFVTAWPCGDAMPFASNLNYERGQTIPNLVLSGIGHDGNVCLFTQSATHLVVDLAGSFTGSSTYHPLVPIRVLDTRVLLT